MGYDKAITFLKQHPELEVFLIYSDDKGNYQVYQTTGLKSISTEVKF
jgi:thiamine biosynthesis lipoprotein